MKVLLEYTTHFIPNWIILNVTSAITLCTKHLIREETLKTSQEKQARRIHKGLEKQAKKIKEYRFVPNAQNQGSQWYIDSGCWKHMKGDKIKFLSLNWKKEYVCHFWK